MKWCHSSIFGIFTVSDTVNRAVMNTSCIRKPQVISGGGAHPLHPPPRSAPAPATMNVAPSYFHRKIEDK